MAWRPARRQQISRLVTFTNTPHLAVTQVVVNTLIALNVTHCDEQPAPKRLGEWLIIKTVIRPPYTEVGLVRQTSAHLDMK